jgi:hypothetical protein
LGWIPLIASLAQGTSDARLPLEFYVPEAFSHLLIYGLPHLSLARTLFLMGWLLLFGSTESPQYVGRAILAGVAWLGMALIVPFYVGLLGVLIGAWLGALWLARQRFPLHEARVGIISGVMPLLVMLYTSWVFTSDPVYTVWWAQNTLPSPPLIDYLLAYGLLLIAATIGALHVRRQPSTRSVLLLVWPPVAALLIYSPINVQRRLLEGVIVPLSILATHGILALVGQKANTSGASWAWRLRQVAIGMLLILLYPSVVLLLAGGIQTGITPQWPIFHPADELEALNWLQTHAPEDSIVLAMDRTGNLIPVHANVRVYIGHGPETVDADRKREETEQFFHAESDDERRRRFINEAAIDYVWVGVLERAGVCAPEPALGRSWASARCSRRHANQTGDSTRSVAVVSSRRRLLCCSRVLHI